MILIPQDTNFNEGPIGFNQGTASDGPGYSPLFAWWRNTAHSLSEQFWQQGIGHVHFGRLTDVFTSSKRASIVYGGNGRGSASWLGGVGHFGGAGEFHCPCPGDHCVVFAPPTGDPIVLGWYPAAGDRRGSPYDAFFTGVSSLHEIQHNMSLDQANVIHGYSNSGQPFDLLTGDRGWISGLGASISLLGGIARLASGPMAAVETYEIEDLVRINARQYEVNLISGTDHTFIQGDQIFRELGFSSLLCEALGKTGPGLPINTDNDSPTAFFTEVTDAAGIAIDRVKLDMGHHANLVHLFVKKPTIEDGSLARPTAGAGVAEFLLGKGGEIALRSAKKISIGKVSRIAVPKRKANYWEVDKSTPAQVDEFVWPAGHPNGRHLPGLADEPTYRRDQYELQQYQGREDFHDVPTSSAAPAPVAEDGETPYTTKEASLEFRDDGSVAISTSGGSCIELTAEGDIRISACRDLIFEAARHTHVLSGHDMNVRARKNIELTATEESIRLKSQKTFSLYSKDGAILLETESSQTPSEGGDVSSNVTSGIVIRSLEAAPVLIESKKEKIMLSAEKDILCHTVEDDSKFYIESPKFLANIATDFEATARNLKWDIGQSIGINTTLFAVNASAFGVESSFITLTAGSFASFYAPGPGVQIAHIHPPFTEIKYRLDPDLTGSHTIGIIKTAPQVPIFVTGVEETTFEDEAEDHTIDTMDNVITGYRSPGAYNFESLYETCWQQKASTEALGALSWTLLAANDIVRDSAPFPGAGATGRFSYGPTGGTGAGVFTDVGYGSYLVFPDTGATA